MTLNRGQARNEAKKIYKEQIKANKVPKSKRLPFSEFYKKYKEHVATKANEAAAKEVKEDFDFDDMVSFNNSTEVVVDEDGSEEVFEHVPAEFIAANAVLSKESATCLVGEIVEEENQELCGECPEKCENCTCKKENI